MIDELQLRGRNEDMYEEKDSHARLQYICIVCTISFPHQKQCLNNTRDSRKVGRKSMHLMLQKYILGKWASYFNIDEGHTSKIALNRQIQIHTYIVIFLFL